METTSASDIKAPALAERCDISFWEVQYRAGTRGRM